MRHAPQFAYLTLSLIVAAALAIAPGASGSAPTGNTPTATGNAGSSGTGNGNGTPHHSGSGLLCAGLLESGILGDVFTVAAGSTAHRTDPAEAIQFEPIWSDSHQTTVGATSSPQPATGKPAVAIIKLPIAFSEADRQKFTAAGWKPHKTAGSAAITYCLDRSGGSDTAVTQGMICVTAAP